MKAGTFYATLSRAALHRRLSQTLRLLLLAGAIVSLSLAVAFAADNLFNLSAAVRTAFSLALLGGLCVGTVCLYLRYWRAPVDPAKMAVYVERRYGIEDNSLINAVHFDRDPAVSGTLKAFFDQAADASCRGLDFRRVWQHAALKSALRLCAVGFVVFLVYVAAFSSHAKNAFLRYLNPATEVTPLNVTQFAVTPGDAEAVEGGACLVHATAAKFGRAPDGLDIVARDGSAAPLLYPMRASEGGFVFELRDLARDTRYAVKNGNDVSRWYTVSVCRRPALKDLSVTVTPPVYTGEKPVRVDPERRETTVLRGSRIEVRPNAGAGLTVRGYRDGKEVADAGAEWGVEPASDTQLSLDVKDARGRTFAGVWLCRFKVVDDKLPEVRFTNRDLNLEVGLGQSLLLNLDEGDDYGLSALELYVTGGDGEKVLKRIDYREVKRARNEVAPLVVADAFFARNASYRVWARAFDNHVPPQVGVSPTPVMLHVADLAKDGLAGDQADPYVRLFAVLAEALDQEKSLRDWVAVRVDLDRRERIGHVVRNRQEAVHERISLGATLASELFEKKRIRKGLADGVAAVKRDQADPLLLQTRGVAALSDGRREAELNDIVLKQSALIESLQRLLGSIGADNALDARRQEQMAEENQEQKLLEKLQKLKDDLGKFQEDQKKVLAGLEAIDKKSPEDWTEDEEKLLGDLAAREQEWAKLFRAAFNDLSKVPNQDFSNSFMADELVEMVEELQKSGAALEKKHIEIATVNEELLGEQASSIATNLERWLADSKDFIKWNGEEGGVNPDVPLQDLPAELTDIIGDLIDDVQDMEDVEDSSNTSLSSFDKGIGWGATDGNMNDMSAKGITGNSMPNNSEVGGRSGEGRSGKSSGQFVEQEATGKGGRDTPTRLVQSPFEKGTVRDTSKDPQGGATGGGKQSGLGGEGLRGITPTQKPDVQQRLPGKQAELKQKAEALMRELNVRNLPTGDLESAITKMEKIQKYRSAGQGLQMRQVQSELLSSLKDASLAIKAGASGGAEKSRAKTKPVATVRHVSNEPTPEGYETSVDAYFRALAEPEE